MGLEDSKRTHPTCETMKELGKEPLERGLLFKMTFSLLIFLRSALGTFAGDLVHFIDFHPPESLNRLIEVIHIYFPYSRNIYTY